MRWLRENTVLNLMNLRSNTSGRFGVEVEMEGNPGVHDDFAGWRVTTDGSLRGGSSREYVFSQPRNLNAAMTAVNSLYNRVNQVGGQINDSMRAGVHIHMNVQGLSGLELFNLLTVYYAFEELIVRQCGPDRQGNLFCLRMIDAMGVNTTLARVLRNQSFIEGIDQDAIRYAAMNLCSLLKYGSIEFRAIQTPMSAGPINEWLTFWDHFLNQAVRFGATPPDVLNSMSAGGIQAAAERLFGAHYERFFGSQRDAVDSVEESIRCIQAWVYMNNWN